MAREDRVDDLRHDGVVEADDAREEHALRTQPLHQVFANLVLHAPPALASGRHVVAELGERCCTGRGGHSRILHRQALLRLGRWPSFLRPGCPGPSRLRTAAARRSGPRTPSRRSTTACRSARTVSSSTSTCRATASSSSTTTPRWNAPPARAGRCRRSAPVNSSASTPVTGSPAVRGSAPSYPFRGRGLGIPRLGRAAALPRRPTHHRAEGAAMRSWPGGRSTRFGPRARSSASCSGRSTGRRSTRRAPTSRGSRPAPHGRRRAGRSIARACAGRSADPATASFRCRASGSTMIVTPHFIAHAHRAGLPVRVWTVDRSRGDRAAARLGGGQPHQRPAGSGGGRRAEMDCRCW